jgi:hypothetical protein
MGSAMFINAGPLLGIARGARDRSAAASEPRSVGTLEPLVSVAFSVAAMEAFLNELVELTELIAPDRWEPLPAGIRRLVVLLNQAEADNASIAMKFMLARTALVGEPFDKGTQPYQDFALLLAARNALVHYRPLDRFEMGENGAVEWTPPRLLERLRSKSLAAVLEPNVQASWLSVISTPAVAAWACQVAVQMVTEVIDAVPAGPLRRQLDFLYARVFDCDEATGSSAV